MQMNPEYPVYIISKGRHDCCLTAHHLGYMGVPYKLVIEPQEYDLYTSVFDKDKIYVLPFSNLGQGSIPARNWVMNHSISIGAKRHWIMDDNIRGFMRLNHNLKIIVQTGTIFKVCESFTDRYENVGLSGLNYFYFCKETAGVPAYYLNTRIYSCILVNNAIGYRWRGKYNEDTDLSLRVLKDGWCTILFNAFLALKAGTMSMKGGNTDNVYIDGDNRMKFAQSLYEQHPDVVEVKWKFKRWHHQVDYSSFQKNNKLIRKPGLEIPNGVNNYGMVLIERGDPRWIDMGKENKDENETENNDEM